MQLGLGQAGPGEEVLVYTNSPLHLTAPAQHVAECNMGVKGISIDFQCLCKSVDSAVLATVQKEVEAAVILGWWPRQVALLVETRDALAPQVQALVRRLGDLMVVVLTQVVGRAIGLIGRGIAQGMGRSLGRG